MTGHVALLWIHRVFSLIKRWGLGTYHGLRPQHLDTYLNEFVFRYNRRFYRHVSFETMLGLAPPACELLDHHRSQKSARTNTRSFVSAATLNSSNHQIWSTLNQRDKPRPAS